MHASSSDNVRTRRPHERARLCRATGKVTAQPDNDLAGSRAGSLASTSQTTARRCHGNSRHGVVEAADCVAER